MKTNYTAIFISFFFPQVKLVDVEKVEWLNRRSYSAIGLLLGREGRVLLRCDEGLEDWFELLEVCNLFIFSILAIVNNNKCISQNISKINWIINNIPLKIMYILYLIVKQFKKLQ